MNISDENLGKLIKAIIDNDERDLVDVLFNEPSFLNMVLNCLYFTFESSVVYIELSLRGKLIGQITLKDFLENSSYFDISEAEDEHDHLCSLEYMKGLKKALVEFIKAFRTAEKEIKTGKALYENRGHDNIFLLKDGKLKFWLE